ncbi:MAG: DUF6781 family protein [Prochlorococcaceae cyanobacterium]
MIGEININLALAEDGQAFPYRHDLSSCDAREYLQAEFRPSRRRHGIWQEPGAITRPWDFRRSRRSTRIPDGTTPGGSNICSVINSIPCKPFSRLDRRTLGQAAMTTQNEIPSQEEAIRQEVTPEGDGSEMGESLEQDVCAVLTDDPATIAGEVRNLTLRALTDGTLDRDAIQRVVRAVVAGATTGAEQASDGRQALQEALRGLDQALAAVAQAIRLTLEEAIGNSGAFSRQTLRRRLEDLSNLESLFVETVSQTASSAAGFTRKTLVEVADHARTSGSAVGTAVKGAVTALGRAVAETVSDQVDVTTSVLQKEAALLASITSGVLRGITDRLRGSQPPVVAGEPGQEAVEGEAQEPQVGS